MDAPAIFELLRARFGDAIVETTLPVGPGPAVAGPRDAFVKVSAQARVPVLTFLRDEPALRFDFLQNLTVVDWPKAAVFELVHHLHSYPHGHELVVKIDLPRANPRVASAAALWGNADWLEREQYDLLGVVFEGHPDLRRLMLPDDWVGHPMRKDYVEAAEYRGMPTTRPSPLDMLATFDASPAGPRGSKP